MEIIRVGKYFTLAEFTMSQIATRNRVRNNPPTVALAAIRALCSNVLDPLREQLKAPIVISSGYRSPQVNALTPGSSTTSQHVKGEAADFICPAKTVEELFAIIRASDLPFDQLIYEGGWIHISYSVRHRRRDVLKATFTKDGVVYKRLI